MVACLFLHVDVRSAIGEDPYAYETPLVTTGNAKNGCEACLEER